NMQNIIVSLVGGAGDSESVDLRKCIICQFSKGKPTTSIENGLKRILKAAAARKDHIAKMLCTLSKDTKFVYHMDSACYKGYTHKKFLENICKASASTSIGSEEFSGEAPSHCSCSSITPRPGLSHIPDMRELSCVICGHKKHKGEYQKYYISECDKANKFLEATMRFPDEVYILTCDLQSVSAVFGADLYCTNLCIKSYLINYERILKKGDKQK
ncbi:hypothetical protein SK128_000727, partial [Halocaridina rubra]